MKKRSIITLVVIFGGLFIGLMIFIGVLVALFSDDVTGVTEPSIGVVEIEGPIMEGKTIIEHIRDFEDEENIKGVIIRVNSPGGAVAPSQEIYYAVQRLAEEKPVVVSMGTTAASGGYYIAAGAETIFANPGTITGSIGVITQFFNVERLVERLDLEVHTVASGDFKDAGSPFKPFEPEDEAVFAAMVFDIHTQFVEHVAEGRGMEVSEVNEFADGRVFTGRQALELNLIDEVGSLRDTAEHLADKLDLEDPPLIYPPEEPTGIFDQFFGAAVESSVAEVKEQTKPRIMYQYVGPQ